MKKTRVAFINLFIGDNNLSADNKDAGKRKILQTKFHLCNGS